MAKAGDSGVVVLVPDAEPAIGSWRLRHDPSAAQGMPAHVTLLYPFLPEDRLDDDVVARLRALVAAERPVDLVLARTARFEETVYLAPEPEGPFRRLTAAIAAAWPEAPPYGGQYDDVTPHLTIADRVGAPVMDAIDEDVGRALPLRTTLEAAQVFVFSGSRWELRHSLPFGPAAPA